MDCLRRHLQKSRNEGNFIIIGDFNTHANPRQDDYNQQRRQRQLNSLIRDFDLVRKSIGPTRYHNEIDGIICSSSLEDDIENIQVIPLETYDHKLIFLN